jgi:hypothetical protein
MTLTWYHEILERLNGQKRSWNVCAHGQALWKVGHVHAVHEHSNYSFRIYLLPTLKPKVNQLYISKFHIIVTLIDNRFKKNSNSNSNTNTI